MDEYKIDELNELFLVLRENGVHSFKNGLIEVQFNESARYSAPMIDNESVENTKSASTKDEGIDDETLYYSAR